MDDRRSREVFLLAAPAAVYDRIRIFWCRRETSRRISLFLLAFFIAAVALILLNRSGWLPSALSPLLPAEPFAAVRLAFSLILAVEVVELILALSDSVSLAVGKQLEIMALLLLRESFTDISLLDSHVALERDWFILMQIGLTAVAGLVLFGIRLLFARWQYIHSYRDMQGYVDTKKCISLFLLIVYCGALGYDARTVVFAGGKTVFFEIFYTSLIFTDILLVLVGQYFTPSFKATFRNSGFAVSTLLMRIAIGAPHHVGAALCVFAGLYLLALSWLLLRFETVQRGESPGEVTRPAAYLPG
ncbi:MAG: hypothetical protein LIP28_00585 [Deltaproteobacteria bacterium]|nr:hypothetical protein [Deltaproteobacteria bacterium]